MARSLIHVLRLFVAVIAVASSVGIAADSGAVRATKLALLVGIDEYKSPNIPRLRGAVNDVRLMQEILIGKFGFSPTNIVVLANEQATHKGIVDAIKTKLIDKARAGDVVVLHFSGHGSQMKDISGDEIDKLDETLVPYDSRTPGNFDISDDEINGLLRQLGKKTKNITFIFDSCHSGAAARGGNTVRQIEPDMRTPPPAVDFAVSNRGVEGGADLRPANAEYVLISGSLAKELSNETEFEGRRHGVLTWYLAAALKAAPPGATYRSVMDQVRSEVTTRFPSQTPQIEGPGQDLVLFGTDKINVKPYVLVEPSRPGKAKVEAGRAFGVGKGSTLKVFPPRTVDFDRTRPTATLKIAEVSDFESEGQIQGNSRIQPHSRAVLEAVAFGDTSIPVFIDTKHSDQLSKLKQALSEMQALKLVESESGARLIVNEHDDKLWINSGDLELLVPPVSTKDPSSLQTVTDQVKDIVHWLVLLDLKNPNSKIDVGLDLRRVSDPPNAPAPQEIESCSSLSIEKWRATEEPPPPWCQLTFRVHNKSQRGLYVYVLDVSSDGSVGLLFPAEDEQQQLEPGKYYEPRKPIAMMVPDGQRIVHDTLKVIATAEPIKASVFPQGPIRTASKSVEREGLDPLSLFLAEATRGSRFSVPLAINTDRWVTVQKTIDVRRAAVKLSSFALHFAAKKDIPAIQSKLGGARALCADGEKQRTGNCDRIVPMNKAGTILELVPRATTRGGDKEVSVGSAFDDAYRIQDETGARRVEPLLELQVPGAVTNQGIDKRDISGDDQHDAAAQADDQWSLKQIQAPAAWKKIRDRLGLAEGEEASGILIAHPDTGYRHHPETWSEVDGKRPIDSDDGRNYYEGGNDALDPLLSDRLVDNPGHGTASGSVIISPPGCQLPNAPGCVNGIARGARLIPLRVHRTVAQFNTRNLSQAIQDVADGNIPGHPHLVSIAMGGPPTLTMWNAVRAAEKNGILIVAASGNYVGIVVWPARFRSTIAVAADNVRCHPWKYSSYGSAIDIVAPGESVWRATLNEQHQYINGMGKGTTFATGNVAGAAALWLSSHRNDPQMLALIKHGEVTKAFRGLLHAGAWRPSGNLGGNPAGTQCDISSWDDNYGPGILNAAALIDVPLDNYPSKEVIFAEDQTIPLFSSLYPDGSDSQKIRSDYLSLFASARRIGLENLSTFETEVMYHYTANEDVQRSVDMLRIAQRGGEPITAIRRALARQDLSSRLRQAIGQ